MSYTFKKLEKASSATYTVNNVSFYKLSAEQPQANIPDIDIDVDVAIETYEIPNNAILYGVSYDVLSANARDGVGNAVYTDDCVGLTPALITVTDGVPTYNDNGWDNRWPYNQIKPCAIDASGNIIYLNPNNIKQDTNGNNVDIATGTKGNIFVEIPKMYYRFHKSANDVLTFQLSNCKRYGFTCASHMYKGIEQEKVYIGAFATSLFGNKVWSLSRQEKLRSNNLTTAELRGYSHLNGNGYEMMNINILNLLEMLFIIQFKSLAYKNSIGYGYAYNSTSGSLKTTGQSITDNYPTRTYGYLTTNQRKVDRFLNIEGFASFADFALDGIYAQQGNIGFMNVYGPTNNFIDDINYTDYMFYDIIFPTSTKTTKNHIVNNYLGLFPCEFYDTTSARPFDLFRTRLNSVGEPGSEYRIHFPNLGTNNLGLFSYNIPLTTFASGIQGHRMVYYANGGNQQ